MKKRALASKFRRQQFEMAEMRDVEDGFCGHDSESRLLFGSRVLVLMLRPAWNKVR